MQLVEQHLVRKGDPRFAAIDATAFASKNLYNQAMYQIRQAYIHQGKYLPYAEVFHLVKGMDCYKAFPAKVANSLLILLHKNWVSFFKALEAYQEDPSKFLGRPRIPGYKDKERVSADANVSRSWGVLTQWLKECSRLITWYQGRYALP